VGAVLVNLYGREAAGQRDEPGAGGDQGCLADDDHVAD